MSDVSFTILMVAVVIVSLPFLTFYVVKFGTVAFFRGRQAFTELFDNESEGDNGKKK